MKFFTIFLLILFCSCEVSKKQKIDQLVDEVMNIHDEIMPVTDKLYTLRQTLQKRINADTVSDHSETLALISKLEDSENAMFEWMRNFNISFQGQTDEKTISYFTEKKKSIIKVSEMMKEAQQKGQEAIIGEK